MIRAMTIRLTAPAEDYLRDYLDRVRRSMGRGVEASDVEAGIREHIDAELRERAPERAGTPATREDVADVIDRLGPPEGWEEGGATTRAEAEHLAHRPLRLAGFGLIGIGAALTFTARWGGYGWLLMVGGSVVLRAAATAPLPGSANPLERLADAWWRGFAVVAALGLLLLPAALAWGAAQIGGVLEAPLMARLGDAAGAPGARALPYWLAALAVASFATGAWWVLVGRLIVRFRATAEEALGSARQLVPPSRGRQLTAAGIALLALSLAGLFL